MDNQFRNVKAHARLQSKAMWYEWRMKLLEGLKEGLDRHVEEMRQDEASLSRREKILDGVVPALVGKHSKLTTEAGELERSAEEMRDCDQEELRDAQKRLAAIDAEIAEKKKRLSEEQKHLNEKNSVIDSGSDLRNEFILQIQKAEEIQEQCRGWGVKEVKLLKGKLFIKREMMSEVTNFV